jgi:hypothetical protein
MAHSPEEFMRIDSLVPRAQACARAILRLRQAGLSSLRAGDTGPHELMDFPR